MDQKRLFIAIAVSIAILLGFQMLHKPVPPKPVTTEQITAANQANPNGPKLTPLAGGPAQGASPATTAGAIPENVPRVPIEAPRVRGSISLLGARLDDLILTDYRETIEPNSPKVRLLEPLSEKQPYFVQFGWDAPVGTSIKVPDNNTVWTASPGPLTAAHPVTLTWDNGAGLIFEIKLTVDDHYMFDVQQSVRNATGAPVQLFPWSRIRRDYLPEVAGYYILFEGMLGVENGTLREIKYTTAKTDGAKNNGLAATYSGDGGWAGITDKYWLTSLVPDQAMPTTVSFRHFDENGGDQFQVDYLAKNPVTAAPGATGTSTSRLFAGAKVVRLLDRYAEEYHIPHFDKAVDFGWFYFLTKPIFYALDWLNSLLGNFGLAIMVFTVFVKALFFPLANYSYRSMSRMKLLQPKLASLRERLKDNPQELQSEMMKLYKAEQVNPASGCLPMLVQIPVFFSLYKVIFVTIEMRQAPFFGWIRDLSQIDPTNIFNLFGLLPFDPTQYSHFLHLGVWPIIMGFTMYFQQRLNPPPPDPVQAKLFQFMPVIFTFMLANFPAGLVIYWSWNNTLSIAQQWLIQRRTRLPKPGLARTT